MKKQLNNLLIITTIIVISIGCDKVDSKLKTVDSADQVKNGSTITKSSNGTGQLKNGSTIIEISSGNIHSCALLSDNTVKCWGYNEYGQLGDGSTTNSIIPVVVKGLSSVIQISSGSDHTCAILSDQTVRCWGHNLAGQLGDVRKTESSNIPVVVKGLSSVIQISSGSLHNCAILSDQTVKCWGDNEYGQLGNGSTTESSNISVVKGLSSVTQISANGDHSCALLSDKTVKCWGHNFHGQLGDGSMTSRSNIPVIVKGLSSVTKISNGSFHSCALLSDKTVKCWGDNLDGHLEDESITTRSVVTGLSSVVKGLSSVTHISSGNSHSCALLSDKTVKCWGVNKYGKLGDGSTTNSIIPVVVKGLSSVTQISSSGNHSCAILSDQTIKCWGSNYLSQPGDNRAKGSTPVLVKGLLY